MSRSFVFAIAAKEFTENVLSRRFQIALVLATLLMITSVTTLALNHKEDEAAHQVEQAQLEKNQGFGGYNSAMYEVSRVVKDPNPLAIFAGGPGNLATNPQPVTGGTLAWVGSGTAGQSAGGSDSPTTRRFVPLDLAFVSIVIMTFMAVIFAYDAVSGERERGTLKLMLTNPVPKDAVLLGKYVGGMASVLLPFAISVLVGLALFQFLDVHLTWSEWGRLGLIVLFFLPLASAFYLLGLLFSALFKRSNTSLLALLLVWLLLVFGAGNVAATAAKTGTPATSDADLLRQFEQLNDEEQSLVAGLNAELNTLYTQLDPNATLSPAAQQRAAELQEEMAEIYKRTQAQREAAVAAARREHDNQLRVAESVALLSPAEAYKTLATALARTDYWSTRGMLDEAELYMREVSRLQQEWFAEHSTRQVIPGGSFGTSVVLIDGPTAGESFQPPAFIHRPQTVGEQVTTGNGILALLVLLVYNVGAFMGAYLVFLRYDVR